MSDRNEVGQKLRRPMEATRDDEEGTARRLSGREALSCGVVPQVARDGELVECALRVASAAHAIPAELLGVMKPALGEEADLPWAQAMEAERGRSAPRDAGTPGA